MTVNPDNIGVLVLAAGFSRRFAGDKRQALLSNGQTVLQATLDSVPDEFTKRLVVLRKDDRLAGDMDSAWEVVFADNSAEGMGSSLAAGISACSDWSGALVALGDMPWIQAATWLAIRDALCTHDIVQPEYQGQPGHPVGFRNIYFSLLSSLSGDTGARRILKANASTVHRLDVIDEGVIRDIDTADDL